MLKVVRGVVKTVALVVGLAGALFGLMALVGLVTGNGWVRLIAALVIALAVPLVIVEKFLPDDDPTTARGLPTDVLAVSWLAVAALFAVLGGGPVRGMLLREAERNWSAGWTSVARAEMRVAGARPVPKTRTAASTEGGRGKSSSSGATGGRDEQKRPPRARPDGGSGAPSAQAPDAGTPDAGNPGERTPAELFREFAPAVVTVTVLGRGPFGEGEGGGTGFLIDSQGTIATNEHVIHGARQVKIKLYDGSVVSTVEVLDESREDDLALLRIAAPSGAKRVVLGDSEAVTVGERVIAIGNPLGLEHTLTDGLVSARRRIEGRRLIQTSAPVSPGNSGGPLFNMRGEVIGVTAAQYGGPFASAQNLNLAIPINALKAMIRDQYPDRHRAGESGSSAGRW